MPNNEESNEKAGSPGNVGSDGADLRSDSSAGIRDAEAPSPPDERDDNKQAIQAVLAEFSSDQDREAADRRVASLARDAIRKEYNRLGGAFQPDPDTMDWITYTLSPPEQREEVDARQSSRTPPLASRLLALLRISYPQIRHYAVNLVSQVATDTLFQKPTSLKVIAHKSGMKVSELEALAERANVQEAAFFKAFLPESIHRELQLAATASVNQLAQEMFLVMDRTLKKLKGRGPFYHGAVMQADIERRR